MRRFRTEYQLFTGFSRINTLLFDISREFCWLRKYGLKDKRLSWLMVQSVVVENTLTFVFLAVSFGETSCFELQEFKCIAQAVYPSALLLCTQAYNSLIRRRPALWFEENPQPLDRLLQTSPKLHNRLIMHSNGKITANPVHPFFMT